MIADDHLAADRELRPGPGRWRPRLVALDPWHREEAAAEALLGEREREPGPVDLDLVERPLRPALAAASDRHAAHQDDEALVVEVDLDELARDHQHLVEADPDLYLDAGVAEERVAAKGIVVAEAEPERDPLPLDRRDLGRPALALGEAKDDRRRVATGRLIEPRAARDPHRVLDLRGRQDRHGRLRCARLGARGRLGRRLWMRCSPPASRRGADEREAGDERDARREHAWRLSTKHGPARCSRRPRARPACVYVRSRPPATSLRDDDLGSVDLDRLTGGRRSRGSPCRAGPRRSRSRVHIRRPGP